MYPWCKMFSFSFSLPSSLPPFLFSFFLFFYFCFNFIILLLLLSFFFCLILGLLCFYLCERLRWMISSPNQPFSFILALNTFSSKYFRCIGIPSHLICSIFINIQIKLFIKIYFMISLSQELFRSFFFPLIFKNMRIFSLSAIDF